MGNCHNITFMKTHQTPQSKQQLPPKAVTILGDSCEYDTLPYLVPPMEQDGRIIEIINAKTFVVAAHLTTPGTSAFKFKITLPDICVPDMESSDAFEKDLAIKCVADLRKKYMNRVVRLHGVRANDHDGYMSNIRPLEEAEPTISLWLTLNKRAIPSSKYTTGFSWETYYNRRPTLSPVS